MLTEGPVKDTHKAHFHMYNIGAGTRGALNIDELTYYGTICILFIVSWSSTQVNRDLNNRDVLTSVFKIQITKQRPD